MSLIPRNKSTPLGETVEPTNAPPRPVKKAKAKKKEEPIKKVEKENPAEKIEDDG